MNIILASEVIHPGGAETFILRLAQALHKAGHKVVVFVFYKEMLNRKLCTISAPDVKVIAADIPASSLLSKVDGLLFRTKTDYKVRDYFIRKSLKKLIRKKKTNIIHSHLLKVDKLCLDVTERLGIPVVNTVHGDYLQFFEKTKNNTPIPLLNYSEKAHSNLKRLSEVVCISDKQTSFFTKHFHNETKGKVTKIYNGYRAKVNDDSEALRNKLGIKKGDFVFGMVSRGIPEKGWQVAIDAFLKLNRENTHLILTGKSDYLTSLEDKYGSDNRIHFTGHSDNPINWINIFDVGLLPSVYPSESLPTVIIEYLYCSIPVIASDAGEIKNMTGQGSTPCGLITPIQKGEVDVAMTTKAMQSYMDDAPLFEKHRKNAGICYQMFDMDKCVEKYTGVYKKAIERFAP